MSPDSDISFLRISGGIFTMSCLFTVAVFIALSLNPTANSNTLNTDPSCAPEPSHAKNVVTFQLYSFTCFFFSTFTALALKLVLLPISNSPSDLPIPKILRIALLVPTVGSACGVVFMTLALINVVQMRLGTCSVHSVAAIVPLTLLLPLAPIIYLFPVVYAFTPY